MDELKAIKYDLQLPQQSVFMQNIHRMFALSPETYPDIAPVIKAFKGWDFRMDSTSYGASIFLLAVAPIFEANHYSTKAFRIELGLTDDQLAEYLRLAQSHLMTHFGTLKVKYGDLLRHRRGNKDYPIGGFPDVMGAMLGRPEKDGTFTAFRGDDLILFVTFTDEETSFETVKAYGNSNRPESPHYNDQMEMYLQRKAKPMTHDLGRIIQSAKQSYSPE